MTVKFSSIADAGNLDKERVILKSESPDNLGRYALFRANASSDGKALAGDVPHVYWFADFNVKPGDLIVLYTKSGTTSEKKNDNGTTSHFLYWGYSKALWTPKTIPVVVSTPSWQFGAAIK
jgi:hypothetical protein